MERSSEILQYKKYELLQLQAACADAEGQRWEEILAELPQDVAEELQELEVVPDARCFRRRSKNSERRLRSKAKREALHALSINALGRNESEEQGNCDEDLAGSIHHRSHENTSRRSHHGNVPWNGRPCYTEDTPEAESFQPPAFAVEGEPDFDSGPPQDGWEYLRRVKYETARCPKVVVAEIDPTKLTSEQTAYMPEIPGIPACPPDLLPSNDWEKQFLGDFSLLRTVLSNTRLPRTADSGGIPSLRNKAAWELRCFGSVTSVQQEELKGPETVVRPKSNNEVGTACKEQPPPDSTGNDLEAIKIDLEASDDEKEQLIPFVELIERELDQHFHTQSEEPNYVIDLGSLNALAPLCGEWEGSSNEFAYLITGDPAVVTYDFIEEHSHIPANDLQDDSVANAHPQNLPEPSQADLGEVEVSASGIMPAFEHLNIRDPSDDERMDLSSSYASPLHTESDCQAIPDLVVFEQSSALTLVQNEGDSAIGNEAQAEHIQTVKAAEVTPEGIECTESYASVVEELSAEGHPSSEFIDARTDYVHQFDNLDFVESYGAVDAQYDYLASGQHYVYHGESEYMIPTSSYLEVPEFENAELPITDFEESIVGLEIYHAGNTSVDEPYKGVDPSDDSGSFKLDPSVDVLFIKVFQLAGVSQLPLVYLLLRLDEVSRATLFRYHVSWLEAVDGLPQDRALWLLALSAVVDMPLDAQTSAAFRAVLRRCAGVRAAKNTSEDLYLLNALMTVAGLYFGQAETSS